MRVSGHTPPLAITTVYSRVQRSYPAVVTASPKREPTMRSINIRGKEHRTAHDALVGKPSMSMACMGRTLVVPGQPDNSLLLQKLSPNPPCGNRMPQAFHFKRQSEALETKDLSR